MYFRLIFLVFLGGLFSLPGTSLAKGGCPEGEEPYRVTVEDGCQYSCPDASASYTSIYEQGDPDFQSWSCHISCNKVTAKGSLVAKCDDGRAPVAAVGGVGCKDYSVPSERVFAYVSAPNGKEAKKECSKQVGSACAKRCNKRTSVEVYCCRDIASLGPVRRTKEAVEETVKEVLPGSRKKIERVHPEEDEAPVPRR